MFMTCPHIKLAIESEYHWSSLLPSPNLYSRVPLLAGCIFTRTFRLLHFHRNLSKSWWFNFPTALIPVTQKNHKTPSISNIDWKHKQKATNTSFHLHAAVFSRNRYLDSGRYRDGVQRTGIVKIGFYKNSPLQSPAVDNVLRKIQSKFSNRHHWWMHSAWKSKVLNNRNNSDGSINNEIHQAWKLSAPFVWNCEQRIS